MFCEYLCTRLKNICDAYVSPAPTRNVVTELGVVHLCSIQDAWLFFLLLGHNITESLLYYRFKAKSFYMKNFRLTLCALTLTALFSCKKETITTQQRSLGTGSDESAQLAAGSMWQGAFLSYNGLPGSRIIRDKFFIGNGYARIYSDSIRINRYNYYSTQFRLVIPSSFNIKGDSLNFEIGVKNPASSSMYDPFYGRDISLYIKGETNDALITNVVASDINPDIHESALIRIGGTVMNNVAGLQYNFEDWGTLILQTFNRGVVAYRNNEYLGGVGYGREALIGRLKEIDIIFKGSGFIDYVKLSNSVNGKLLMSEDFNTDGQSTIVWY